MQTKHCSTRSQQRGVPPMVKDWLLSYGQENHDGHGAIVRYFNDNSIRQMEREIGREPIRRMSEFLRCYLVEGIDGAIITIGKRYLHSRINRV